MSIGYQETRIPAEKLIALKQELDSSQGEKKYYRYKAWLHYANLDNWQKQGHHFHYLTNGSNGENRLVCTCGLYVAGELAEGETINSELAAKLSPYSLDHVQITKGHRSLDNFESKIVALIFDYVYNPKTDGFLWNAYCQVCGALLINKKNHIVKEFVEKHNSNCLAGDNAL